MILKFIENQTILPSQFSSVLIPSCISLVQFSLGILQICTGTTIILHTGETSHAVATESHNLWFLKAKDQKACFLFGREHTGSSPTSFSLILKK